MSTTPLSPLPEQPSTGVQHISPGLSLEWLYDHRMVYITLKNMSRDTVDLWVNTLAPIMKDWPREKSFRVLYDATDPRISLTPYLRTRLAEFNKVSGGMTGRAGLLMAKTFVAQITQLFLRSQYHPTIQTRIFFDRDEAMSWIAHGLDTTSH